VVDECTKRFNRDGFPTKMHPDNLYPSADVYTFFLTQVQKAVGNSERCELKGFPIVHGFLAKRSWLLNDNSSVSSWIRPTIVCEPVDRVDENN
jgi:hypothetical protein